MAEIDLSVIAQRVTANLEPHLKNIVSSTNSFRKTAEAHNSNVRSIIKDVYNTLSTNQKDINDISSSIDSTNSYIKSHTGTIKSINSTLNRILFSQNQTYNTLLDLNKSINRLSEITFLNFKKVNKNFNAIDNSLDTKIKQFFTPNTFSGLLKSAGIVGAGAIGAGAVGASVFKGINDYKNLPPSDQPTDRPDVSGIGGNTSSDGGGGKSSDATPKVGTSGPSVPTGGEQPTTEGATSGGIRIGKNNTINKEDLHNHAIKIAKSSLEGFKPEWAARYGIDGSAKSWASFISRIIEAESSHRIANKNPDGTLQKFPTTPGGEKSYGPGQFNVGEYGLKTWDDVNNPEKVVEAISKVIKANKFFQYFGERTLRILQNNQELGPQWTDKNIPAPEDTGKPKTEGPGGTADAQPATAKPQEVPNAAPKQDQSKTPEAVGKSSSGSYFPVKGPFTMGLGNTSYYGAQRRTAGGGVRTHHGHDLYSLNQRGDLRVGREAQVIATEDMVIKNVVTDRLGDSSNTGNFIDAVGKSGKTFRPMHLGDRPLINPETGKPYKVGDTVKAGQPYAYIGGSGTIFGAAAYARMNREKISYEEALQKTLEDYNKKGWQGVAKPHVHFSSPRGGGYQDPGIPELNPKNRNVIFNKPEQTIPKQVIEDAETGLRQPPTGDMQNFAPEQQHAIPAPGPGPIDESSKIIDSLAVQKEVQAATSQDMISTDQTQYETPPTSPGMTIIDNEMQNYNDRFYEDFDLRNYLPNFDGESKSQWDAPSGNSFQ